MRPNVVAFEGIAGAGKTSCFAALMTALPESFIFLSEVNPEPSDTWPSLTPEQIGDRFHQLWVERSQIILQAKAFSFIVDRSYLSNLAFCYAYDSFFHTSHYQQRKKEALQDFAVNFLSTVFVLRCNPEISVRRRTSGSIPIPYPWGESLFLEAFNDFYENELASFTQAKIHFLDTTNAPHCEILGAVLAHFPQTDQQEFAKQTPELFQLFAENEKLGACLGMRHVMGQTTAYYRQHSLQLQDNKIVYFNNKNLKKML